MRSFQILLCGVIVAGGSLCFWWLQKTKQDELDAAAVVAEVFLSSTMNGDSSSSFGLASKSYQERYLNNAGFEPGRPEEGDICLSEIAPSTYALSSAIQV